MEIIISIIIISIALFGMLAVKLKIHQLNVKYAKGSMYVDTYELKLGTLQSQIPMWGLLLLLGLLVLGISLVLAVN